jgi:hypothetical protein
MAVYSVFEPPERNNEAAAHAERFTFVRDGFSWSAFMFGPVWMLWHRLWLVLIGYIGVALVLALAVRLIGANDGVRVWSVFFIALLVGLEAASLRRWTLARRGWNDLGIVVADDLEAAERRFFGAWAPNIREQARPAAASLRMSSSSDVIGLFPEPGANR